MDRKPGATFEHRQAGYKNQNILKADEMRRRREDAASLLRKQKKDESLAKRRVMVDDTESEDEGQAGSMAIKLSEQLPIMIKGVWSDVVDEQLDATQ
ncbi:hypothetical protein HK096_000273, partial [Nowakowskiella sp. JEL0078]